MKIKSLAVCTLLLGVTVACGRGPKKAPGAQTGELGALVRASIDADKHPDAVCNDGTTPVFYVRRGTDADKWVLWFKGGSGCGDEQGCKSRMANDPTLTSSKPWMSIAQLDDKGNASSADGKAGGILSASAAQNPDFHTWNHVYMVYCSSDMWTGNRGASPETWGMHFRGEAIADAMLDAMRDASIVGEPTIDEASAVLVTGSSAGGIGARHHIDRFAGQLDGVAIKGFSDAAITPSVTPARGLDPELEKAAGSERLRLWGTDGQATCAAKTSEADRYLCIEGRHLVEKGYIKTPMFHHMDQLDPLVIGRTAREDPAVRNAAAAIRATIEASGGGISPATGTHIVLNNNRFNKAVVDGHSPAEIFGNWYFDRKGPKVAVEMPLDDPNAAPRGGQAGRGGKRGKGRKGR